MPPRAADHFRYSTLTAEMKRWGAAITGAGTAVVRAGAVYPPRHHQADHLFTWSHGRVLDHLQIVMIVAGKGWLETRATGLRPVEGGMALLLLPGVWHRYRPDPKTGWTENWVEMAGPVLTELVRAGTFPPGSILRHGAMDAGLDELFTAVHQQVRKGFAGYEPELAALALRILAGFLRTGHARQRPERMQRAVIAAQDYLSAHHAEPLNIEHVAAKFGIAYSHFRRAFRARTGLAPWQYVVQLRLARARRLLAASDAKLDDIAERIGFSSGFHLSLSFKRAYGLSPSAWRGHWRNRPSTTIDRGPRIAPTFPLRQRFRHLAEDEFAHCRHRFTGSPLTFGGVQMLFHPILEPREQGGPFSLASGKSADIVTAVLVPVEEPSFVWRLCRRFVCVSTHRGLSLCCAGLVNWTYKSQTRLKTSPASSLKRIRKSG